MLALFINPHTWIVVGYSTHLKKKNSPCSIQLLGMKGK
jgi:hypothetical protein